ncbi:hypothetical protein Aab01nite_54670 [Paractinoplanes abujensis]|uniref:Uncharacterized protein n=1 Tax=Paractinoplanes abujensis TaxID=882441 RepID=A0A7W7CRM4_9ACTN|nr:hypothetical protein [Actinoplanes abujensis]GID21877.1 hypothetical protein Aab01nite_54670 [Actinoplanes abujensis]
MKVFKKLMCGAGLHSGQWSLPGRRCASVRVCVSCGRAGEKVRHTWGGFVYVDADRCGQVRRCERCGTTESRIAHDWGPWLYANVEFNSPQFHKCGRCHETEKTAYTSR